MTETERRDDPLVPHDFSSWVEKLVDAVGRSWAPIITIQLALVAPGIVLEALFQHSSGLDLGLRGGGFARSDDQHVHHVGRSAVYGGGYLLYVIVAGAIVAAASTWLLVRQADRAPAPVAVAVRFGLRRAAPLVGWGILAGGLVGVGFLLLLVPGIYLGVVFFSTLTGVVVIEGAGIRRCFQLARGRFWMLFARVAITVLAALAYSELVMLIIKIAFRGNGPVWAVILVSTLLQAPFIAVQMAFLVITYAELRGREDGMTTAGLRAAMDDR